MAISGPLTPQHWHCPSDGCGGFVLILIARSSADLYALSELVLHTHQHKHVRVHMLIAAGHTRIDPWHRG